MNERTITAPRYYMSIREFAKLGLLSEYALRCMERSGNLPTIKTGNRALINVALFAEQQGLPIKVTQQ